MVIQIARYRVNLVCLVAIEFFERGKMGEILSRAASAISCVPWAYTHVSGNQTPQLLITGENDDFIILIVHEFNVNFGWFILIRNLINNYIWPRESHRWYEYKIQLTTYSVMVVWPTIWHRGEISLTFWLLDFFLAMMPMIFSFIAAKLQYKISLYLVTEILPYISEFLYRETLFNFQENALFFKRGLCCMNKIVFFLGWDFILPCKFTFKV